MNGFHVQICELGVYRPPLFSDLLFDHRQWILAGLDYVVFIYSHSLGIAGALDATDEPNGDDFEIEL